MIEENQGLSGRLGSDDNWRPVLGYEGLYEVSRDGRIHSIRAGRQIAPTIDRYGYANILLGHPANGPKRHKVHRLVCRAFHGSAPDGLDCAHLDGDRLNNSAANLAWATRAENEAHKLIHGTRQPARPRVRRTGKPQPSVAGEKNPKARLSATQVAELKAKAAAGRSAYSLAGEYGVSRSHARRIVSGERWAHV